MGSGVKVVKRRRNDSLKNFPIDQREKTDRQSNGEIVSTVKSWIAELELRRLSRQNGGDPFAQITAGEQHKLLLKWTYDLDKQG
jgi:hypothetical protein